uniref:Putative branched-chain amino acid transport ATP-binding protein LivG n=1 Tax=Candidatus Methanophaga sp. ANME-1 ERB7 TaxID=2759913 RepID=A0A7G9Z9R7_9EURY|nr:putative branched-chain amino acid transport ATP-binding protein LivG [Methanosarcinales archaeon ANME-1 ERB7]
MLKIKDLTVEVEGKEIIRDLHLNIEEGEVHVLFGPNGCGKTTLLMTLLGFPSYKVTRGIITFKDVDITNLPTNERVKLGMGMSFQHPPEIRGVKLGDMVNIAQGRKEDEIDEDVIALAKRLNISVDFLNRDVNLGFSGGEVKRSEILQLLAQAPDFIMFDEPDSGVDVENIELIGKIISELLDRNKMPSKREKSGLIITHSGSIMRHIKADRAHVMLGGRIACSGMPDEITKNVMETGFERCVELCVRNKEVDAE